MTTAEIANLVSQAIENLNLSRVPSAQIRLGPDEPLFGQGGPLDSLGLVSLLIDVEEALADRGFQVSLSDPRAMSQANSPFRNVDALVGFIHTNLPRPS